ncbi:MAG: hypothetical protein AAGN15_04405 [Cyanobacteria bacterium J06581_3]
MSIKELIQAELELLSEDELAELYELMKNRSQKSKDSDDELGNLLESCQVNTGISDLSYQHDHYLYGTPKRAVEQDQV